MRVLLIDPFKMQFVWANSNERFKSISVSGEQAVMLIGGWIERGLFLSLNSIFSVHVSLEINDSLWGKMAIIYIMSHHTSMTIACLMRKSRESRKKYASSVLTSRL